MKLVPIILQIISSKVAMLIACEVTRNSVNNNNYYAKIKNLGEEIFFNCLSLRPSSMT